MYKVLIVDDEEMVRWGIRDLLDWETMGFLLTEDGKDGRDGLLKLKAFEPDLVLVDIKMPGMTGLELIRAAREDGFLGQFVILTGYSDFEFAKTAITLGVSEYLLKPIDEDELESCVEKIRKKLDQEAGERKYHSENEGMAKEGLLRRIVTGMGGREELESCMERCQLPRLEGLLCTAVLTDRKFWEKREDGTFWERVNDFLQDSSLYTEKIAMDNHVVLLGQGMGYEEWAERLRSRNGHLRKKLGEGLLIAVGHNVSQWHDLCYSYEFARFLLGQDFLFGKDDVLSINTMQPDQMEAENPTTEQIGMLIEVGDLEGISECVERFKSYCMKKLMRETDIRIQILYNLVVLKDRLGKKYGMLSGADTALLEKLNRAEKLDVLTGLYTQILQEMCCQIGADGSDTV